MGAVRFWERGESGEAPVAAVRRGQCRLTMSLTCANAAAELSVCAAAGPGPPQIDIGPSRAGTRPARLVSGGIDPATTPAHLQELAACAATEPGAGR